MLFGLSDRGKALKFIPIYVYTHKHTEEYVQPFNYSPCSLAPGRHQITNDELLHIHIHSGNDIHIANVLNCVDRSSTTLKGFTQFVYSSLEEN